MAFAGNLRERAQAQVVLLDVPAAVLVGGKGERLRAGERRARPGNPQREAFERLGAQAGVLAARLQAGLDDFVEDRLEDVGGSAPETPPGGRLQERSSSRARVPAKSTKYFTSGASGSPLM